MALVLLALSIDQRLGLGYGGDVGCLRQIMDAKDASRMNGWILAWRKEEARIRYPAVLHPLGVEVDVRTKQRPQSFA